VFVGSFETCRLPAAQTNKSRRSNGRIPHLTIITGPGISKRYPVNPNDIVCTALYLWRAVPAVRNTAACGRRKAAAFVRTISQPLRMPDC
jgi:hypothetical protein